MARGTPGNRWPFPSLAMLSPAVRVVAVDAASPPPAGPTPFASSDPCAVPSTLRMLASSPTVIPTLPENSFETPFVPPPEP